MFDLDQLVQASEQRMPPEIKKTTRSVQEPPVDEGGGGLSFGIVGDLSTVDSAAPAELSPVSPQLPSLDPDMLNRVENLGVGGAKPSTTELERLIGNNDLVDEFYLQRALVAARPIMRIILRDSSDRERGWATGFMVSPQLLLTNHHVFPTIDEAVNAVAEANYVLDIAGNPAPSYRFAIRPDQFYYAVQDLDFALVAVERTSMDGKASLPAFGFHRLNPQANKIREKESMTLIQHPDGARRQVSIRENQLVKITDGYLWYQSDTAPGSSGAPAFNDSFQVVGLHHSGVPRRDDQSGQYLLKDGRKVGSLKGLAESDIVWIANEGVRISAICAHLTSTSNLNHSAPLVQDLFAAMQGGGDVLSNALKSPQSAGVSALPAAAAVPPLTVSFAGGAGLTIPLQITLQVSAPGVVQTTPSGTAETSQVATPAQTLEESALEALSRIRVDRDYRNRGGYDEGFLGVPAPLPVVDNPAVVSHLADGTYWLPYEHFSVVVHKHRRLPLFTAANLDYSESMRHPEPGKYSRTALTGTEREVWLTDPRIPQQDQLPDRFYTRDGGNFDKGHVVRREDACWGASYAQVVRGNCDTFHVTNCTPQVAGFNRSKLGIDDWGDLEDEIQRQAKAERLCVFAGPILSDQDRIFDGQDDFGPIKLQIPKEYWKVVLANDQGRLAVFAFILQQDLTSVPLEFAVNATWQPYQVALMELEGRVGGFHFPAELHTADQYQLPEQKIRLQRKKDSRID